MISMNFTELWRSNVRDVDLINETEKVESYCPITEDILLDDDVLCHAVENVETEQVFCKFVTIFMMFQVRYLCCYSFCQCA